MSIVFPLVWNHRRRNFSLCGRLGLPYVRSADSRTIPSVPPPLSITKERISGKALMRRLLFSYEENGAMGKTGPSNFQSRGDSCGPIHSLLTHKCSITSIATVAGVVENIRTNPSEKLGDVLTEGGWHPFSLHPFSHEQRIKQRASRRIVVRCFPIIPIAVDTLFAEDIRTLPLDKPSNVLSKGGWLPFFEGGWLPFFRWLPFFPSRFSSSFTIIPMAVDACFAGDLRAIPLDRLSNVLSKGGWHRHLAGTEHHPRSNSGRASPPQKAVTCGFVTNCAL